MCTSMSRLMRKVRAVDYNSVNFAWEVEEVQVESEVTVMMTWLWFRMRRRTRDSD